MIVRTIPVGMLACNCTVLIDDRSGEAIVVDGGDGVSTVVEVLRKSLVRAKYLLHTHAHIDHIGDVGALRAQTGGEALLHADDLPLYGNLATQGAWLGLQAVPPIVPLDGELRDGDRIVAGAIALDVLHTPGHTPGSVCFAFSHGARDVILSGDTLFAGSIGRWDLGGTSMEDIIASIRRKLFPYPDSTGVIPGHGPSTTIGTERLTNPYLQ